MGGDKAAAAARVRAVVEEAKAREEEAKKKKTKTVKLTQEQIDFYMEMSPPRPIRRFDAGDVLELWDPEDPEWFELGLGLMELAERSVPMLQAWQDKKASIRGQFLANGEAFVEVTEDEAEAD